MGAFVKKAKVVNLIIAISAITEMLFFDIFIRFYKDLMMRYTKSFMLTLVLVLSGCARRAKTPKLIQPAAVIQNTSFFDAAPGQQKASYLFVPGFMCTEFMMGTYCPEFVSSITGEKISWKVGGHTIGQPHSSVTFPELDLTKPTVFTMNPVKAIANSIRRQIYPLTERFMYERCGIHVIDNPESEISVTNYTWNFSKANIGQAADIKALQNAYAQHIQRYPNTDVILYGDSRGAATIFNFVAIDNPRQVKAAVIAGGFDAIPHLMKHSFFNDKDEESEKKLGNVLSFFAKKYRKEALSPRHYVETIADDIPILFVTSLNDWFVPAQSTFYLYNRMRERGLKNVHVLVLKKASHVGYMLDDAQDKEMYETVVHAFYKNYNLPHNQAKAQAGKAAFAQTQPTREFLATTYNLPRCMACS
jgi:hypothetical protein